ncbi:MAG: hypothetical protein ACK4L7_05490 [Flavobacteriales bacterium]
MKNQLKTIVMTAAMLLASPLAFAQGKSAWKELSEFHAVMSQTFHPAEEGNLEPIRKRSAEMVEKAKAWKASAIPADYKDIKGIEKSLDALVDGAIKLDQRVKSGAEDAALFSDLNALHDVFHTIVGLCRPGH